VDAGLRQPRVAGHVGLRHHAARVHQVHALPVVGVLAAHAGEVRPGALGTPLERPVVDRFLGGGVVAVALGLETQRADHLRVAEVAALAHVDVLAGQPQRIVRMHVRRRLERMRLDEQRGDLGESAQRDHDRDADAEQAGVLLDRFEMPVGHDQPTAGSGAGIWWGSGSGIGTGIGLMMRARASAAVYHRFHAITHMPERISTPPNQRIRYIGLIAIRLSRKPYFSEPSGRVARHISPSVTPAVHIAPTYSRVPAMCSQKCTFMPRTECIAGRPSARGAIAYSEPIVIIATQPSEPECTWAIVQSV